MWLRQHGAKRSMRKYLALNSRRRPSLDPLENRYLLSGGIEVIEVHPVPALIVGIDFRQTPHPPDVFGNLAVPPVSSEPAGWSMPGFHHDFAPLGGQFAHAAEFHTYSDPQVVPALISPVSIWELVVFGLGNAAASIPNSESVAAVSGPQVHGDVPPVLLPPPFLFLGGDPGRIPHAARDLSTRPLQDGMTPDSAGDTSQANDVTVSPPGNQTAVLAQGGNSIGQIAPSVMASPGHLTTLFNPDPGHDDRSIRTARSGEFQAISRARRLRATLPALARQTWGRPMTQLLMGLLIVVTIFPQASSILT